MLLVEITLPGRNQIERQLQVDPAMNGARVDLFSTSEGNPDCEHREHTISHRGREDMLVNHCKLGYKSLPARNLVKAPLGEALKTQQDSCVQRVDQKLCA